MKRRTFLKRSALFSIGISLKPLEMDSFLFEFNNADKGIVNLKEFKVITLTGNPRKRGQIYGEELKAEIETNVQIHKSDIERTYNINPDEYIKEFIKRTNFTKAIKKWTPELLEEVRGIAEGSGQDFNTIYRMQLVDEGWWYSMYNRNSIDISKLNNCSCLGVFGQKGAAPLLAQNLDYDGRLERSLLHIKYENSPLESYVFTESGMIGAAGMNNHSVGVCVNSLLQLDSRIDGLPVAFIVRGVIGQKRYKDAVNFVRKIKHASGQAYLIGGEREICCYEASADKVVKYEPHKNAKRVYHTNHPFVNDDRSIFKEITKNHPKREGPGNSEVRFNTLEKYLRDESKEVTADYIKSILSSHDDPNHPICVHRGTIGSLIYELSEKPVLYFAPGPPCQVDYKEYRF